MKYTYCKKWFIAKKSPIDIWDINSAEQAHQDQKPYTVLVGDLNQPKCFIELIGSKRYVGVEFLDELLRIPLNYQFQERASGSLFLSMATYREFQNDSDVVTNGTSYIFKEDGTVMIENENFSAGTRSTCQSTVDVSGNWEQYPSFGDYSSIIRVERGAFTPAYHRRITDSRFD